MKKKIIIIIVIAIIMCLGVFIYNKHTQEPDYEPVPLSSFEQFKNVNVENIESAKTTKFTEGGGNDEEIKDVAKARALYTSLSNMKIGKETDMACEDNTTVYTFYMKDKTSISIEIECDWIVMNGKRYLIE